LILPVSQIREKGNLEGLDRMSQLARSGEAAWDQDKMRVMPAAKLLIIAWTLMKKKEPFNPDF
jgi:hypothetical protein